MYLATPLDPSDRVPLYQQLYEQLRQAILSGRLKPGHRLPSSRELAKTLAIGRLTVIESFDRLLSEGYFEARRGSGTYVSTALNPALLNSDPDRPPAPPGHLSAFGTGLAASAPLWQEPRHLPISFAYGRPAIDAFPLTVWRRLLTSQSEQHPALLDYTTDVMGYRPLREAIVDYLALSRAIRCSADQILIVNGSQHGLDLIARMLLNPGDRVAVEDPGYLGARTTLMLHGATIVPIPVDDRGLQTESLPTASDDPIRLIYVTPSHQFPTGAALSLPRRLELLDWAERHKAIIIEDDYDSEFRFDQRPIPALRGLDRHGVTLYLGTFSKVMFPSLRIGYLVLPAGWAEAFAKAKWLSDRQSPLLEQAALAAFVREGHLERHVRRTVALYGERRQVMIAALTEHFGETLTVVGENAGMHVVVRLRTGLSDEAVISRATASGVGLASTQPYYVTRAPGGEFILSYAALEPATIREGIRRLATAVGAT